MKLRNMYQDKWRRPPSANVNHTYKSQIENYQNKAEPASMVNKKIIEKYHALEKFINIIDEN